MLIKDLKEIINRYNDNVNVRIVVQWKVANLTHYEEFVNQDTQEPTELFFSDKEITEEYFINFKSANEVNNNS